MRVAINGYGRIGRNAHRQFINKPDIKVVAINSRADVEMRTHLLRFDSLHGRCSADVRVKDGNMIVNEQKVLILTEKNPENLPWKDLDIDIVIESTGINRTKEKASKHIQAGAKKVIVSAPMKDETPTFVIGVNEDQLKPEHTVISNASCTTNCIAPPLNVLEREFGIENVLVSAIHAFTDSQNLLDNSGEDLRRARSAVMSIIPTTTGSVKATGLIIPSLKGKLDGMAFRVPLPSTSCTVMDLLLKKETTAEEINRAFEKASEEPRLKGILGICHIPLVSIDFKTDSRSSVIDAVSTKVVQGKHAQVVAWYDNEWAYATRLTELVELIGSIVKG